MQMECQIILFLFLPLIYIKSPEIAKALSSSVFAPDIFSPISIAIDTQLVYSYRRW